MGRHIKSFILCFGFLNFNIKFDIKNQYKCTSECTIQHLFFNLKYVKILLWFLFDIFLTLTLKEIKMIQTYQSCILSSGSSSRGGPRNMKSMQPPLAAIYFMTYFHRAGRGAWPPRPPWIRY